MPLNHFMMTPPITETLVSNLSVCLFQVSHLFLQFHPLGLWGCLHWSSYFKTHLVFSQASLSPRAVWRLALPSVYSVCLHLSFLLPLRREAGAPLRVGSSSPNTSQTWLLGCCVSFSTLNWQWVPTLTFQLQVYSEVCRKRGSQPKVSRFPVKGKRKLCKRLDGNAITHTQYLHVTFQSGKPHLLMYWPSSTMQIKPI